MVTGSARYTRPFTPHGRGTYAPVIVPVCVPGWVWLIIAGVAVSVGLVSQAAAAPPAPDTPPDNNPKPALTIPDGQTVVFLGDAVTQQHQFTAMVEAFVRLRYPERRIHFFNASTRADTAEKAATRLASDILPLFGKSPVNGVAVVGYGLYEAGFRPLEARAFERYQTHLRRLLDGLTAAGVRVVLCSPTPVDDSRSYQGRPLKAYNEVLAQYSEFCQTQAAARALPYADLLVPLLAAHRAARTAEPRWAVFDSRNPIVLTPAAHLIIACHLLDALAADRQAQAVVAHRDDQRLTLANTPVNAEPLSTPWSSNDGAVLQLTHVRRPVALCDFELIPAARRAASLVPPPGSLPQASPDLSGTTMNSLVVAITGLPSKVYHLRLDGRPIGTFSSGELAAGVDLMARATPAARQLLLDDLRRIWNGVALKDGLHLRRFDKALANDAPRRERLERELTDTLRRLDDLNAELARPMRLTILPGHRTVEPSPDSPHRRLAPDSLLAGRVVRHLVGDRYFELYLPTGYNPREPSQSPLLIWLHPDGSAPEAFDQFFRQIADRRGLIVALPRAWRDSWSAPDDRRFLIEHVLAPLRVSLGLPPTARALVAGHGRGAALAAEMALADSQTIAGALLVSLERPLPKLPDSRPKPSTSSQPTVFLLHGDNDPTTPISVIQTFDEQLRAAGFNTRLRRHDKGRRIPEALLEEGLDLLIPAVAEMPLDP